MRTRSAQLASVKRSMRGACGRPERARRGFEVLRRGVIVHVGHEQHTDRALFLCRQDLLDGDGGLGRDHAVERAVRIALAGLVLQNEGDAALHPVAVVVVVQLWRVNAKARISDRRLHRTVGAEPLRIEVLLAAQIQARAVGRRHLEAAASPERRDHQVVHLHERAVLRPRLQPGALEPRAHELRSQRVLGRPDEAPLEAVTGQEEQIRLQIRDSD